MKINRELRAMVVVLCLVGAVAVALLGISCFGGGNDGGDTTLSLIPLPDGAATTIAPGDSSGATTVAQADDLSTFNSKDPFIPQAKPVTSTTKVTPTTILTTTTSRATTTTRSTTTTVVHRLTVIPPAPAATVTFTLDGMTFANQGVGAQISGSWGSVEIMAIDLITVPNRVEFRRNGSIDFSLQLNQTATW